MKFDLARIPQIVFGQGALSQLTENIKKYGKRILLVTGRSSFQQSRHWDTIVDAFNQKEIEWNHFTVSNEPSPELIDDCVLGNQYPVPEVVVAIGGGSVLDAGKAISAMWPAGESVRVYLEGVGDGRKHDGRKIPFIAIPTTAGTGSEVTKNAVISQVGKAGFKKSLRHENFVPDHALIDPRLTVACPPLIAAWSGMDAFTQLLESYLSTHSNLFTDLIAESGLKKISKSLEKAVFEPGDLEAKADMAYAALCSGITLANAGLGVVHGFASSIGGRYTIPHGLICGTLMGVVNEFTLNALLKNNPSDPAVNKYAEVGRIFHGTTHRDPIFYAEFIINKIHDLTEKFDIPGLGEFGLDINEIEEIAGTTSCKYNPIQHNEVELAAMLERRI